jgi:hypothetical protein
VKVGVLFLAGLPADVLVLLLYSLFAAGEGGALVAEGSQLLAEVPFPVLGGKKILHDRCQ